jgi:hypothetical protein
VKIIANEEAARIILSEPERYAGLPLEWARLWMDAMGTREKGRRRRWKASWQARDRESPVGGRRYTLV